MIDPLLRIASAAFALLLIGVAQAQTLPEWLPVQSKPVLVTLGPAQQEAVQRGLLRGQPDPGVFFIDDRFSAAEGEDGVVIVCGKLSGTNSNRTHYAPFIGKLAALEFNLLHWAATSSEAIAIEVHCNRLDLSPAESLRGWDSVIEAIGQGR